MKKLFPLFLWLIAALLLSNPVWGQKMPENPTKFFGFKPGADRQLFTYEKLIDYFKLMDSQSNRLKLIRIGSSPMGKPMYVAMISNEQNIARLDQLKEINKQLALNPDLTPQQRAQMIKDGRVFIYATLSMHSNEVGPSQASPLIAYELITSKDPKIRHWLDKTVYMMVPCHNPDGMDMVVNNYLKYRGTEYEGASLPGVYHKYVGHDNNRDFITLSQTDTKAIANVYDNTWYPQVMFEKHQMGSSGVRYFVPPPSDVIAQVIDAGLWDWMKVFGANMITDMTADSLKGIAQQYIFDDYWPGSTETCLWKNVIAMLTECASAKFATPVYVEPTELHAGGKGLAEYKKSINMPDPWKGGWWHLSDIVQYEISSTKAIIKTAALHKDAILKYRNDLCRKEVKKGETEAPYFYIVPVEQHDPGELVDLVHIMHEQGINIYRLKKDVLVNNRQFHQGDIVFPMNQAYRPFIKEVMEAQSYPIRHFTPGGKIIRPYDITSWSLPLHKGLKYCTMDKNSPDIRANLVPVKYPFTLKETENENTGWGYAFSANDNESYQTVFALLGKKATVYRAPAAFKVGSQTLPAGSFVVKNGAAVKDQVGKMKISPVVLSQKPDLSMEKVKLPRIALMVTWFHDMDAGWTRFIFDTYHIPYTEIHPGDVANLDFSRFDILVFPDMSKNVLMDGKYTESGYYQPNYPPEYTKGIGKEGMQKIMTFVNNGGRILSWGRSVDLFEGTQTIKDKNGNKASFVLPFRNIGPQLRKKGLYCPGTFVRVNWKPNRWLTYGMANQTGIFYRGNPVFTTWIPGFGMDRRVMGWFPEKNLLMSGYAENLKMVGNKPILVWVKKGKGDLILYGFSPIFRASTPVTYKLVFNGLLRE